MLTAGSSQLTCHCFPDQRKLLLSNLNLGHNDRLRALLRNENLEDHQASYLLQHVVRHSKIDSGEAVSILLEDGRSDVHISMLETENKTIKAGIRMCP